MHLWILESACTTLGNTVLTHLSVAWKTAGFEWVPEQRRALVKIHTGGWDPLALNRTNGLWLVCGR